MSLEILLVEDSPLKRQRITELLQLQIPNCNIREACSFTAGSKALQEADYGLAILDMTLPTYDRTSDEPGGRVRTLGGREIARKISRTNTNLKVIFVTQYRSFSDVSNSYSFESLETELRKELGSSFLGMLFFDSSHSEWRNDLSHLLEAIK